MLFAVVPVAYPPGLELFNGSYDLKETAFTCYPTGNASDDASRKVRKVYSEIYEEGEWNGAKLVRTNVDWKKKKEVEDKAEENDMSSLSVLSSIERRNERVRERLPPSKASIPPKTTPRSATPRSASNSIPARRLPVIPSGKLKPAGPVSTLRAKRVASPPIRKTQSFGRYTENKADAGRGGRHRGVASPAARSVVVSGSSGVERTADKSVQSGEASALGLREDMVKGVPRKAYNRLKKFFEFVDSVPSMQPDDSTAFFECLSLDAEIQKCWRMVAHYLMVSDRDIDEINRTSFYVEEKCMRVLKTWREKDVSADYLEVIYAVINTMRYNSAREAKPHIPLSSFDSITQQSTRFVSVPFEPELLEELEKELAREKEKGMLGADVTLQGHHMSKHFKVMKFRLLALDNDGLKMVEFACKGAAADDIKELILVIKYLSAV